MFHSCNELITAPQILPSTTLAQECYKAMFTGCTNLITSPKLPATTLTYGCYEFMFQNCSSLTNAPVLPAITLADSCYRWMFDGCTNLKEVKCYAVEPPSIGYNSESEWDNAVKFILYVPKGSISKYQNSYWGTDYFAKEIRPLD